MSKWQLIWNFYSFVSRFHHPIFFQYYLCNYERIKIIIQFNRWNRSAEDDVKWHQKQNKYHHLDDCYKEVLEKLKKYKEQYQSKRKEVNL